MTCGFFPDYVPGSAPWIKQLKPSSPDYEMKVNQDRGRTMTLLNGNILVLLTICAGNSPVTGEFPTQRPVTRSFDVFFDLPEQTVE